MHTTLPRRFYADPDFYRAELERFYFDRWICAGRADQIPNAGDYFTRTLGDESVIVTRDGVRRDTRAVQRLPSSRHAAVRTDRRTFRRSHPVPVSQLDLRSRRAAARGAAHAAGILEGRLPAAPRRL